MSITVAMSLCCDAPAIVENDDKDGTKYYVCTDCGKPCDVRMVEVHK